MADQKRFAEAISVEDSSAAKAKWSRRSFIGGTVGMAAVGLVACTDDDPLPSDSTIAPTTTQSGTPTTGTGTGNGNGDGPKGAAPKSLFDPATVGETWNDPWVWRPTGDPADVLSLYVVENLSTIAISGGNLDGSIVAGNPLLFSWNGITPGPTIRMKGTDTLYLKLYNQLGRDNGRSPYGPNPDLGSPYPGQEGVWINDDNKISDVYKAGPLEPCKVPTALHDDWCLGEHVNGVHSVHVTNIHTHGLHVKPGRTQVTKPDGTRSFVYSDDVYARVIPRADAARGIEKYGSLEAYIDECFPNEEIEVGEANYEFELGGTDNVPVHPPGTHWYHPHAHGATHQQVAGGMAGFLIVEGDVDAAVNKALAGTEDANPELATGDKQYRERTVLIQRISNNKAVDSDAPDSSTPKVLTGTTFPVVNGTAAPATIVMSPGAIERWRILNGSVDGSGYFRVALLKGEYVLDSKKVLTATDPKSGPKQVVTADYWPVVLANDAAMTTKAELESSNLKADLWQLAHDGVTLVDESGNYHIKDLAGTDVNLGEDATLASCYATNNIAKCYSRPNELRLTTGNRVDVFFQAPKLTDHKTPEVYTLVGLPTALNGQPSTPIIAAFVIVRGQEVAKDVYDFKNIKLPETPEYLKPIEATEPGLREPGGKFRTRTVRYSGWGGAGFPQTIVPQDFVDANPELAKLVFYEMPQELDCGPIPGTEGKSRIQTNPRRVGAGADAEGGGLPALVCTPNTRSMAIDGAKFNPKSTDTPRMELNSVEEWAVFNESIDCYGPPASADDPDQIWYTFDEAGEYPLKQGAPTVPKEPNWRQYFPGHQVVHPLRLSEVPDEWQKVKKNQDQRQWPVLTRLTKGVDHPFHIHQNPFWLLRIDVPDENGELVNVLPSPQWGDVQWIPRNGGRIVFRSRFFDYTGELVNHCHILKHEDNGMMQRIQVVPHPGGDGPQTPNFEASDAVVDPNDAATANRLYEAPDEAMCYEKSARFIDNNPITGQIINPDSGEITAFPGFAVESPPKPGG